MSQLCSRDDAGVGRAHLPSALVISGPLSMRTSANLWNVASKYGSYGESFFLQLGQGDVGDQDGGREDGRSGEGENGGLRGICE